MAKDSSAPKLECAASLALPDETPRAKPLRVSSSNVATTKAANRTALSHSTVAAILRKERTGRALTQESAARGSGLVVPKTVGRYERNEVDLSQAGYVIWLFGLGDPEKGDRK